MYGEFIGVAVEAVDVHAGSVVLEVETILFGAAGDDVTVNDFAVHAVDGEVGVEWEVGGNHHVVGGGIGVRGSDAVGGVVLYAFGFGMDFVDHSVSIIEFVSTGSFDLTCRGEGEETVAIAVPTPADVVFVFVGGGGACNDECVTCISTGACGVESTVVNGTAVVVEFRVEHFVPLCIGIRTTSYVFCIRGVAEISGKGIGHIGALGAAAADIPTHTDGDAAGIHEFAEGAADVPFTVVACGAEGHAVVDEFIGVVSEIVAKSLITPAGGSGACAFEGVLPVADDGGHGSGNAAGGADGVANNRAEGVVGIILTPFGLD